MTNKENNANNSSHRKKLYNKQSSIPRLNEQKEDEDIMLFNFSINCILLPVLHSKLLKRTFLLCQRMMTKRNLNPKSKWNHVRSPLLYCWQENEHLTARGEEGCFTSVFLQQPPDLPRQGEETCGPSGEGYLPNLCRVICPQNPGPTRLV